MSSTFTVATESLTAASAVVAGSGLEVDGGRDALQGAAGALDGTPAMAQYAAFLGAAGTTLDGLHEAAGDLSRALNTAAFAYQAADVAAASSFKPQS
jgi:hypothetical protein